MVAGWGVVLSALVYLCCLFAVAHWGDQSGRRLMEGPARSTIYALALAVYCTSWTFFGSVGLASRSGLDFVTIYIGPVLMIGLGQALVARVVRIAKAQNITSIADFVAARYGKSERVAALVCLIAVIGAIPYIALQLKAVSASLGVFLAASDAAAVARTVPIFGDLALVVAIVLAGFAVAFGTRHTDATEHQDGLMLAIALESVVKLVAFVAVGVFVTFWMFGGVDAILSEAAERSADFVFFGQTSGLGPFLTLVLLAGFASLLLPRQFHMAVVENRAIEDVRRVAWLFPLYLVLINIFVVPLALAGLATFGPGEIDRDMTVLALPLRDGANLIALAAFLGGLSAATAMVIVESVALAIMISNHLVLPLVLRRRGFSGMPGDAASARPTDLGGFILRVRRVAIAVVLLLAYMYYRSSGEAALAAIGLLSFAAIAQIAPAFFGGLFWSRGTALGASAGLVTGFAVWAYTLLLPSIAWEGGFWADLIARGPLGQALLRPTALFGADLPQLMHGVAWSLGLNVAAYVGFSLLRPTNALERLQATAFVGSDRGAIAPTPAPVPGQRLDRGSARHRRTLSRRRADQPLLRGLPAQPRIVSGRARRSRHPPPALRGASARLGHRRRLVAPGPVAAPAPPQRLDQGGAEASRRCLGGDSVQPRSPAARPRSCPPGHHGARPRAASARLEPRLHRSLRAAAGTGPHRHGARRDHPLQRRARLLRAAVRSTS